MWFQAKAPRRRLGVSRSGFTTRTTSDGDAPTISRRTTSPCLSSGSMRTVASSCRRRGLYTHASSPSVNTRAFASSGLSATSGPRSSSALRVAISLTTRSGRSNISSVTGDSSTNNHVPAADVHDQSAAPQRLECVANLVRIRRQLFRGRVGVRTAEAIHRFPGTAFVIADHPHESRALLVVGEDKSEAVPLEHGFDRVPVIVVHSTKDEVSVRWRGIVGIAQEELGDHLVGTGEIDHRHMRKIDHRELHVAVPCVVEQLLDLISYRGAGVTRHEVGVQIAGERLSKHPAHVDVIHHRGPAPPVLVTASGMIT